MNAKFRKTPFEGFRPVDFVFDLETTTASKQYNVGVHTSQRFQTFLKESTLDFRQSVDYLSNLRSEILQIAAPGLQSSPFEGFVKPSEGYQIRQGERVAFDISEFSRKTGGYDRALKYGTRTEAEAVASFYDSLTSQFRPDRKLRVGGWNVLYDIRMLESAAWRHESLSKYRGFWAKHADRVEVQALEEPFLKTVQMFGEDRPSWAATHLQTAGGRIARNLDELREVKGWNTANVLSLFGTNTEALHEGWRDVKYETRLYNQFNQVVNEALAFRRRGEVIPWNDLFGKLHPKVLSNLEKKGITTAEQFFSRLYTAKPAVQEVVKAVERGPSKAPLMVAAVMAGAAAAYGLAYSNRRGRQTQITGLSDEGIASVGRHERTDFGSGYRGSDDEISPTMRLAGAAVGAGVLYGLHKYHLANSPNYARKLYNTVKTIEDRSPMRLLRTLHLSEIASAYLPQELRFARHTLVGARGLTHQGKLFQRVLGKDLDLRQLAADGELVFQRETKGSPFLKLMQAKGLELSGTYYVRFAERGHLAGSATRLRAGLEDYQRFRWSQYQPWHRNVRDWFAHRRATQTPGSASSPWMKTAFPGSKAEGLAEDFLPLYAQRAGERVKNMGRALELYSFNALERTQGLLAKAGIGLSTGSYDKIAHIPFVGKGGLINNLLSKRVLPAYVIGAYLGFGDYLLGHKPSETLEAIPSEVSLLRAKATDVLPGARALTDWYEETVPGPQYGPLALPAMGAAIGGLAHYWQVLGGKKFTAESAAWVDKLPIFQKEISKFVNAGDARQVAARSKWVAGALVGAAVMLPFVPGMLGSRETAPELERKYSGEDLVPIRSGRWWELGTAPWAGTKISYYRPHRMAIMRSHAYEKSLWGSESNYWYHHPLINPIGYLMNPYGLEDEHYADRPYPISAPAFADVPLVGPLLAATVGRVVKPPVLMHEDEWRSDYYRLGSALIQPRGANVLAADKPKTGWGAGDVINREANIAFEFAGFPGFLAQTAKDKLIGTGDEDIYLQNSGEMDSLASRFYSLNLGAGMPVDEGLSTEPIRRFIQKDDRHLTVNDIPNTMPSWLPGPDDYAFSFRHGDPYTKVAEGYIRLPGPGYEALHPEVEGLNPEDYPDIAKFAILADVAYGSTQYYQFKSIVEQQAQRSTDTRMEYDRIMRQVEEIQRSAMGADQRRFSGETEEISGTVASASPQGVMLKEYPGRVFKLSGTGMSAADMSALALGERNYATREQLAGAVENRFSELQSFLNSQLVGRSVRVVAPLGAAEHELEVPAVITAGGESINRRLIDEGLAVNRIRDAGPEAQALFGAGSRAFGSFAEGLSFQGDQAWWNPMRYIPSPAHSKLWQEREPLEAYLNSEVYGTKLRRWDRLWDDFAAPYFGGAAYRTTGQAIPSDINEEKRDLNTLSDYLKYLQGVNEGILTKAERSNVGTDLFGSPEYLISTLPRNERPFFEAFLHETNPEKRQRILASVSPELARTLQAQWVAQDMAIAKAEGREVPQAEEGGRLVTADDLAEYRRARTNLGFGDWLRSREIAEFFHRRRLHLPDADSEVYDETVDPEDVKLKLLTQEGYDYHDFGIYEDRAALLHRKPYVDGAIRELTQPDGRSVEAMRQAVERMIMASHDRNPQVRVVSGRGPTQHNTVRITRHEDSRERQLKDIRRNPQRYQ